MRTSSGILNSSCDKLFLLFFKNQDMKRLNFSLEKSVLDFTAA